MPSSYICITYIRNLALGTTKRNITEKKNVYNLLCWELGSYTNSGCGDRLIHEVLLSDWCQIKDQRRDFDLPFFTVCINLSLVYLTIDTYFYTSICALSFVPNENKIPSKILFFNNNNNNNNDKSTITVNE